jgi:transcriptional regulator with XRE-family HTH domain
MDRKNRGLILKFLREEKKLNQADVAAFLGVSQQAYQRYENGSSEPNADGFIKLADYYNVSVDFLFGRTSIREMNTQDKWLSTPEEVEAVEQKIIDIYTQLSPKLRRAGIGMLMDIIGGFMPDLSRITAALEEEDDEPNENPA